MSDVEADDQQSPAAPADGAETTASGRRRLCAFSGCRTPLPVVSGPGNKARYCQDGKTWGSRGVSCKQAGAAEETLASIRDAAGAPSPALTELAEHITAAIGPADRLAAALQQVRELLDGDVAAAHRERDVAVTDATQERGLRAAAEEQSREAESRADEAEATATTAVRDQRAAAAERDEARLAQRQAETARLRAETQADDAREQAIRAEARAEAAAVQAGDLDRRLASTTSELAVLRAQVETERHRADSERDRAESERQRADQLSTDYEAKAVEHRRHHDEQRDRDRTQATADLQRLRDDHERAREADAVRHASEVADLHRRLGGLERDLAEALSRPAAAPTHDAVDEAADDDDGTLVERPGESPGDQQAT